jgi:hypothetical protein
VLFFITVIVSWTATEPFSDLWRLRQGTRLPVKDTHELDQIKLRCMEAIILRSIVALQVAEAESWRDLEQPPYSSLVYNELVLPSEPYSELYNLLVRESGLHRIGRN